MPKNFGTILIYLSLLVTVDLWIFSKVDFWFEIFTYPLSSLNQICALLGTILFAWSMFLSTRLNFLEDWFGGLDKVYHTHRRVSEWGFGLIIIHPLAFALDRVDRFIDWFLPIHSQDSINYGIYSFWLFFFIISITLLIRQIQLPYHYWKFIHSFLNLAMLLALMHILLVSSDVSNYAPLGWWVIGLTAIGVASGLYKTFFYNLLGPRYSYQIVDIQKYSDVYDIFLEPTGKPISYKAGQFAYVSFLSDSISKEPHPFCITSTPNENQIRFSIKKLGDFTSNLDSLKVGDKSLIWGAYGRISEKFFQYQKDAIFIGGGIGIAPFLALFRTAAEEKSARKTTLFYCTKYKEDACFGQELEKLANQSNQLYYFNQCSREPGQGHLSIEKIKAQVADLSKTVVYLCGPSRMMKILAKDLIKSGFSSKNIVLEDFEMI